ncbi:DUF5666 domain-containing protein [Hydrogenophaga sp.]|uniref:DUF5666 domain-containing protein n=1 Tax=Hydrogenophaga sp. TaxID=1904254 RepID=UPI00286D7B73|nr:DUF5666 domain-containing protein [Hydrogenophaga sp.]
MRPTPCIPANRRQVVLALLGTALLPACGGGTDVAGVSSGGTGSYTSGVIVGLGSVIVNGIRYDDSAASVNFDGSASTAAALQLGMVVRIQGSALTPATVAGGLATATASSIACGSEWKGPVADIDTTAGTFTLLGQKVRVLATTVIEGTTFSTALNGLYVEVYGLLDPSDGSLQASRIELDDSPPDSLRLSGLVSGLTATTFQLGSATILYSSATEVPTTLANGLLVRVDLEPTANGSGQWIATRVRADAAAIELEDDDEADLEGFVTALTATGFVLNGIPVDASHIGLPTGLVEGDRVEVQGSALNGTVIASEIDIKTDDEVESQAFEFHGAISELTASSFVVRGYPIRYDTSFGIALTNGLLVEVKAELQLNGDLLATEIEIETEN